MGANNGRQTGQMTMGGRASLGSEEGAVWGAEGEGEDGAVRQ